MEKIPQNGPQKSLLPRGVPDLAYVRRNISIETVAQMLGLNVSRHFAHCFRTENHADGDREPSLHFFVKRNRAICFGCGDRRAFSNIDLVQGVLRCDLRTAIAWFGEHFGHIPTLRGRPAGIATDRPFRVGVGGELEPLMRSGVFATLSNPAVRVLAVIRELRDDRGEARLPYATLRRKAGIGSDTTVKNALDELTALHLIAIRKGRTGVLQPQNIYTLTPDHTDFVRLMTETYRKNSDAIAEECDYRRELRLARRRLNPQPEPDP